MGEHCKLTQRGPGQSPSCQTVSSTVSTQDDLFQHFSDAERFAQFEAQMAE